MADTQTQPQPTNPQPATTPQAVKLHVTVRNRIKVVFDDDAQSVSSKNATGVFDILPEHSNFISLIMSPLTIRTMDGKKHEITFDNGLLKVRNNAVHCYVDLLSPEAKVAQSKDIKI